MQSTMKTTPKWPAKLPCKVGKYYDPSSIHGEVLYFLQAHEKVSVRVKVKTQKSLASVPGIWPCSSCRKPPNSVHNWQIAWSIPAHIRNKEGTLTLSCFHCTEKFAVYQCRVQTIPAWEVGSFPWMSEGAFQLSMKCPCLILHALEWASLICTKGRYNYPPYKQRF